jgi:hypothetical protein
MYRYGKNEYTRQLGQPSRTNSGRIPSFHYLVSRTIDPVMLTVIITTQLHKQPDAASSQNRTVYASPRAAAAANLFFVT